MRTSLILLFLAGLLFFAKASFGQISTGTLQIQNTGQHYRISFTGTPQNLVYPYPDSASLRVTVVCPSAGTYEVNHIPLSGQLNYRLGGTHYIAVSVLWWKDGVKKSQTSIPTTCGAFTNPINCFQRL